MENARTARLGRGRGGWLGGVAAVACLLAGCDAAVGVPGEGYDSARAEAGASATGGPAQPQYGVAMSEVRDSPGAVRAIAGFAVLVRTQSIAELTERCWNMAPKNVRDMYGDAQAIIDALGVQGVAEDSTVRWYGEKVTVVLPDRAIATGQTVCPYVYKAGAPIAVNDADARHTVRRFLARSIGKPLSPEDQESAYPLVCAATPGWNPNRTGASGLPPLAGNPGRATGVAAFVDGSIESEWPRGKYITVTVPVTTTAGITKKQTYTLESGAEGYCIGDLTG